MQLLIMLSFFFRLSQLLYPTLIAACYQMEENKAILEEEISSKLLLTFLQEACREEEKQQQRVRKDSDAETGKNCSGSLLEHRFPKAHWKKAIAYFSESSQAAAP